MLQPNARQPHGDALAAERAHGCPGAMDVPGFGRVALVNAALNTPRVRAGNVEETNGAVSGATTERAGVAKLKLRRVSEKAERLPALLGRLAPCCRPRALAFALVLSLSLSPTHSRPRALAPSCLGAFVPSRPRPRPRARPRPPTPRPLLALVFGPALAVARRSPTPVPLGRRSRVAHGPPAYRSARAPLKRRWCAAKVQKQSAQLRLPRCSPPEGNAEPRGGWGGWGAAWGCVPGVPEVRSQGDPQLVDCRGSTIAGPKLGQPQPRRGAGAPRL